MTPWTCPRCLILKREGGEVFAGTRHPCASCWASMPIAEKVPLVLELRRRPIPQLMSRDFVANHGHSLHLLAYIAHLESRLYPEGILANPKEPTP